MTRQNFKILKVPFTLFMGTQYGPTAENFFDFFQKISSHFGYGVRNHRICPYFLNFFIIFTDKAFPSTSFMRSHKDHLGEN